MLNVHMCVAMQATFSLHVHFVFSQGHAAEVCVEENQKVTAL